MNIQTLEKLLKQLYEAIARYAGQPCHLEECRQYIPVKNDHPVQRREQRSDYYR